ncbi:MAG: hypothetical protein AAFW89_12515 [Bacteroidota bacterium]
MNIRYTLFLLAIPTVFVIFSVITPKALHAQNSFFEADLSTKKSKEVQQSGMIVLGTWATLNILTGAFGSQLTSSNTRYFHQMNAGWGAINLGIAGFSYYSLMSFDPTTLTLQEAITKTSNLDKLLLLNMGLDLGYIGLGAFLWERGIRKNSYRLQGFGQSIILQGAFLFFFDIGFYLLHSKHSAALIKLTENIEFSGSVLRIGF